MPIIRKPPGCASPKPSGRTRAASGIAAYADAARHENRASGATVGPGGDASGGSRPARREESASTPDPGGDDFGARVDWIMEAEDRDEFVGRVFDRVIEAIMDLEGLLDALEGDGRVGVEYRLALAGQLDHIQNAHLEEWKTELLDGLDADEGQRPVDAHSSVDR